MSPTEDTTPATLVVGASRGFGRATALAFAEAGTPVIAVARDGEALGNLQGAKITSERADAREPATAEALLTRYEPNVLVLVAGASPFLAPLQQQSWETFSRNWHSDVGIAFHWLRAALLTPLRPGSRVIVISSGAALNGSPLSGGYAGAKATQRFITSYAREEATRDGLGLSFTAVLPRITPLTDLGRRAVAAYAARSGQTVTQYLQSFGPPLTPERAGAAVLELARLHSGELAAEYLLTAAGLRSL